jgi:hypothetical protein
MRIVQKCLTAALAILCVGSSLFAMEGKAVTSIMYMLAPFYDSQPAERSKLIVATISGNPTSRNRVVKTDTLLKGGPFYRPTFNINGDHIAFFRKGGGLSVIKTNGDSLRTVAKTADWTWNNGEGDDGIFIQWPSADGGKWIYYHRPCGSGEDCNMGLSGEIWKVNVNDTTQKSMVCDYTPSCNTPGYIARWVLSTDARRSVAHAVAGGCSIFDRIRPHLFPPQGSPLQPNPQLTEPTCTGTTQATACYYSGSCNAALSPSGNIFYMFYGGHTQLYAHRWTYSPNTIGRDSIGTGPSGSLDQYKDVETWLLPSDKQYIGGTFCYPRASCNSDQIVTIPCLYRYGAEYTHNSEGSNLVVANWKDKEAVFATHNPDMRNPGAGSIVAGQYFWFVEPGDFWLQPPSGVNGGYEDRDGNWVGATYVNMNGRGKFDARIGRAVSRGAASLYDLRGRPLGTLKAATRQSAVSHGICVIADPIQGATKKVAIY